MKTYYAVKKVIPVEDYLLLLTFSNGEKRIFDMKPYLKKGIFRELRDVKMFNTVRVNYDTIEWKNEADFDPEDLYKLSKKQNAKMYASSSTPMLSVAEPHPRKTKNRK